MSKFLCIVLAITLLWVWFKKEGSLPLTQIVEKPILVPVSPLEQPRASKIIVGDANGGEDRVVWERSR